MVNYISALAFILVGLVGALLTGAIAQLNQPLAMAFGAAWLVFDIILASGIKMAAQWEKAVVFRLGRFSSIRLASSTPAC